MAINLINGKMLSSNLLRDSIDLSVESDVLYLDVNNNYVGILTSAPNVPLHVKGDNGALKIESSTGTNSEMFLNVNGVDQFRIGTYNATHEFRIYDSIASTDRFHINSLGHVGINTIAPDGSLHIYSADAGTVTADPAADDLIIENSASGGITIVTPDNSYSSIFFGSASDNRGAYVDWHYTGNQMRVGTHKTGAGLAFITDNNVEAARIDSSGFMGIGATAPDRKLIIEYADTSVALTDASALYDETSSQLRIFNDDNTATWSGFSLRTRNTGAATWVISNEWQASYQGDLVFRARNSGTASSEIMRMTYDNKVGIGVANPDGTLHVMSATAGGVTAHPNGDELVLEGSSGAGLSILTPSTQVGSIFFGSPNNSVEGQIAYAHGATANTGYMTISTGNTGQFIKIDSVTHHVGINHAAPPSMLTVGSTSDATSDVEIMSQSGGTVSLKFSDTNNGIGKIVYSHSTNAMDIYTNNVQRINIDNIGIVSFMSNNAIKLPSGLTSERPTSPVAGMERWNSSFGAPEFYDGANWQSIAISYSVTSQQIIPDGVSNDYTLNKAATTDGVLVIVNGIVQDPEGGTVYSVSGTTLHFTSVLAASDVVSVRFLEI